MVLTILAGGTAAVAAMFMGALLHRRLRQHRIAAALRVQSTNSIVEERFVEIGGIEQWIGIRGEDRANPALLIIHGGPGAACSIFASRIRSWEKHFTIVQWDQRGSGKTLGRTGRRGTDQLTMEQLICDGVEVAEYVRRRLQQRKVILLGASFGSMFALSMARRRPDLFFAYVGTDQNVGVVRRCGEIHCALVERLRAAGLDRGAAAVEKIGPDPKRWSADDFLTTAKLALKSDRTSKAIMKMLKDSIWYSPIHGLMDIRHFVSGMRISLEQLLPEAVAFDAWQEGTRFEVPFFIFQGENDVVTMTGLAKEYFDGVVAPVKEFALIRDAGHFAAFMQPEQFLDQLLTRVRPVVREPEPITVASSR